MATKSPARSKRAPAKKPRKRRRAPASMKMKDLPKELLGAAKKYGIPLAVGLFVASAAAYAFERDAKTSKLSWKAYAAAVGIPLVLGMLFKKRFKRADVVAATSMALLCVFLWDSIGAGLSQNKLTKPVIDAGRKAASFVNKKEAAKIESEKQSGVGSVSRRRNVSQSAQLAIPAGRRSGVSGNPNFTNAAMRSPLAVA